MTTSLPRPIPGRQGQPPPAGYMQMPQQPPQPYYPPPPNHPQLSDIRSDAGVPPQPQQFQPGSYGNSSRSYGAAPSQGYGTTPPQGYGTTPPQAFGTTPPRGNMIPPQGYGTTPPRGDPYGTSAPGYMPPNPQQYPAQQARLHPAEAYGTTPPNGYAPQGRPRRGTASSVASSNGYGSGYGSDAGYGPRRQRRRSYDASEPPAHAYEFQDERRRRASEDAAYERKRRRERRQRKYSKSELEDMEKRPTVGDSTVWAWNKLKGAFSGGKD